MRNDRRPRRKLRPQRHISAAAERAGFFERESGIRYVVPTGGERLEPMRFGSAPIANRDGMPLPGAEPRRERFDARGDVGLPPGRRVERARAVARHDRVTVERREKYTKRQSQHHEAISVVGGAGERCPSRVITPHRMSPRK